MNTKKHSHIRYKVSTEKCHQSVNLVTFTFNLSHLHFNKLSLLLGALQRKKVIYFFVKGRPVGPINTLRIELLVQEIQYNYNDHKTEGLALMIIESGHINFAMSHPEFNNYVWRSKSATRSTTYLKKHKF